MACSTLDFTVDPCKYRKNRVALAKEVLQIGTGFSLSPPWLQPIKAILPKPLKKGLSLIVQGRSVTDV
jgi:hypothetical protein